MLLKEGKLKDVYGYMSTSGYSMFDLVNALSQQDPGLCLPGKILHRLCIF